MPDLATFWATDNKEQRKLQLDPAVNYFKKNSCYFELKTIIPLRLVLANVFQTPAKIWTISYFSWQFK